MSLYDDFVQSRRGRVAWCFAITLVATLLIGVYLTIRPPCPRHLSIAAGPRDGAYFQFATQYRELLKQEGIELTVCETAGSLDNLDRLRGDRKEASLAIVQGGANGTEDLASAISLASLYLEPVWIFYRGDDRLGRLEDLAGGRIAIGPTGSGTRALAKQLFAAAGLRDDTSANHGTSFLDLGGTTAAEALEAGRIDAAVFVISPTSPLVKRLLRRPDVRLLDLERVDAYPPNFRYLSAVELVEGVIDLDENLPARNHRLLAANANLVARQDLHPALVAALLKAAKLVHDGGGTFEKPGEYPSPHHLTLPLHPAAKRYFEAGPSLLFRYLPFPLAAWLDQMKFLLLPLFTLMLPLFKTVPPIYRWRIRSKIYRWYRVLREIDTRRQTTAGQADFTTEIATLEALDGELADVSVPLSYMEEFYNLRVHVWFVLGRLREAEDATRGETPLRRAA
ncbi:MAG: ABC transporter substrate-binding protein [Planctomycetales bacterium]|nr:ABC transporter substrate-binding protein [Planctomycetales bacterium]